MVFVFFAPLFFLIFSTLLVRHDSRTELLLLNRFSELHSCKCSYVLVLLSPSSLQKNKKIKIG